MKIRFFLTALIAGIALTLTIPQPALKATAARMVAPSAEPEVRLLEYNGEDYAADVKVGTSYIIQVVNNTGGKIWWIKRSKQGGYKVLLLPKEGIKIQRRISREKWIEATDEYATLIDPDPAYDPKKGFIDPGKNTTRKWTPKKPGNYRLQFNYTTQQGSKNYSTVYSEAFQVNPK